MRPDAYASSIDVSSELPFLSLSATSKPSATQVHRFLHDASNEIDMSLGKAHYLTPVGSGASASREQLRSWTAIGAAMYGAAAMPQGSDSKHLPFLERRWTAILKGIEDGDLELGTDAPKDPDHDARSGLPTGAGSDEPYFVRDFADDI